MDKQIKTALISVFYKEGLAPVVQQLHNSGVRIYSTGGTQQYIEALGIPVHPVEKLTSYPSILGGRVKTLHPLVFGGILGRPDLQQDAAEMEQYRIPAFDLVMVDLYPFQETVASTSDEQKIIEKIDIGGPSMIRAAAKNFQHLTIIASRSDYTMLVSLMQQQSGSITLEQRRMFAAKAFRIVADYDQAIDAYFNGTENAGKQKVLRYGENPHQQATFTGHLDVCFIQLHGKEISYNNLVDIDAAIELIRELDHTSFAIIKHTNVCGAAKKATINEAWKAALAGDPESAFGGVLVCNKTIDAPTAADINEIFFEVLVAPGFDAAALKLLKTKKNRILLQLNKGAVLPGTMEKTVLNGTLQQAKDNGNFSTWEESGGRPASDKEKEDLLFANLLCKHLKSNAIALVKNGQLVGKGCGQTSRVDALRHALEKARQFKFDLKGAVMASDAFFPFNDCVQMGYDAGIRAFIQPGGSIRDKDSIDFCKQHNLVMVLTGMRHFKH